MPLEITKRTVERRPDGWRREVEESVVLAPPKRWGMFSARGNKALTTKAETCLAKINKLVDSDDDLTQTKVRAILVTFVASWLRMAESASYEEAGDTAVREAVAGFHDDIWTAVFGRDSSAWNGTFAAAYKRVYKR